MSLTASQVAALESLPGWAEYVAAPDDEIRSVDDFCEKIASRIDHELIGRMRSQILSDIEFELSHVDGWDFTEGMLAKIKAVPKSELFRIVRSKLPKEFLTSDGRLKGSFQK